jgi:hypothetical protein
MDWLGLHVTLLTHYMITTCSREWGVTEKTQELNHEGLYLESCLLVNCFYGFSLGIGINRLVIAHVRCVLLTSHARYGDDVETMEKLS